MSASAIFYTVVWRGSRVKAGQGNDLIRKTGGTGVYGGGVRYLLSTMWTRCKFPDGLAVQFADLRSRFVFLRTTAFLWECGAALWCSMTSSLKRYVGWQHVSHRKHMLHIFLQATHAVNNRALFFEDTSWVCFFLRVERFPSPSISMSTPRFFVNLEIVRLVWLIQTFTHCN